jgi:hypothetical protein
MDSLIIKNDKQLFFNQIKGIIEELNDGEEYCSITLRLGHENSRNVNLVLKKPQFDPIAKKYNIGDKVCVRFYISSRKKHERWYTTATVLDVNLDV